MSDDKVTKLLAEIGKLTVLELNDLVKSLEEKFGVASVPMTAAGAAVVTATPSSSETKAEEGQTVFNVILTNAGANKISVIKAVRELNQVLGLKEAKDLVEAAPKEVLMQVNKAAAEEAKKKLESAGATVELK